MSDRQDLVRPRRLWIFWLVLIFSVVAGLELGAYVIIALRPISLDTDRASTRLARFSAGAARVLEDRPWAIADFDGYLGWRPNAGLSNGETRINSMGLRSDREYAHEAPDGVLRVAAFGDSFVYGHEVDQEEAWPSIIEEDAPDIEVLNFGVTGFGPDQAYLRFSTEAEAVHPAVVIWAISPWMVNRLVNVYRPFLTGGDEFGVKPRYTMSEDGSLVLIPQPVAKKSDVRRYANDPEAFKQLGEHDYFYDRAVYEDPLHDWVACARLFTAVATKLKRRYLDPNRILTGLPGRGVFNTESEAFRIAVALMLRFDVDARGLGAIPIIMTIPDIHSLRRMRKGVPKIESPLIAACRESGLSCWDLGDAFADEGDDTRIGEWFMPGGHYSPAGNAVVARWIEAQLRELPPPSAASAERAQRGAAGRSGVTGA